MRANDEPPGRYLSIYNFSEWKRSIQSGLRGHFQTRREEENTKGIGTGTGRSCLLPFHKKESIF